MTDVLLSAAPVTLLMSDAVTVAIVESRFSVTFGGVHGSQSGRIGVRVASYRALGHVPPPPRLPTVYFFLFPSEPHKL